MMCFLGVVRILKQFVVLNVAELGWVLTKCFWRFEDIENRRSHTAQLNGFSPVCDLPWTINWYRDLKVLEHVSQLKRASSFE